MAKKTFEQQLERLEEIVSCLEKEETGLEEGIKLYKEGLSISSSLDKILEKAKQEVVFVDNFGEEMVDNEF